MLGLLLAKLWYVLSWETVTRIVREWYRTQAGSWCADGTKANEIHYSRGRNCTSFFGKRVQSIVFS